MKCHYLFDEFSKQKVLIPGCYQSIHSNDLSCCTCSPEAKQPRYVSTEVADLKKQIDYLTKQLNSHIRIIERLTSNHKNSKL